MTVRFEPRGARTEMTFVQTGFQSKRRRDGNAEGWLECFRKLDAAIAKRELRALFDSWFQASEHRDLDASMAPIAADVLSYEHEAPLQVRGVDALRANCKRGFDAAPGKFRWDIPDLRILVRGDLAITWGLNRMRAEAFEGWSRGTRVFQKIDGAWKLIHQHVSYPFDLESGRARTDLTPE